MLTIETTWLDNFFVICGGVRATSVEGYHEEWRETAKALREGRNVHFKRLAAAKQPDGSYHLWSPRNAWGNDDHETCDADDVQAFAERIDAVLDANMPKPTIVCLCGSTRFKDAFAAENERLTLEGRIVLSVGSFSRSTPEEASRGIFAGCTVEQKRALDELHLRKIDLADEVLVLNVGGYVGESTRREIAYARSKGKPVAFLEPEAADAGKGA